MIETKKSKFIYLDAIFIWSAAEGQRPRNYLTCCSWIFRCIYALSTSTTLLPFHFSLLPPPLSHSLSTYLCLLTNVYPTCMYLHTYVYLPTSIFYINKPTYGYLPMYINLPSPTYLHDNTYLFQHTYLPSKTILCQPTIIYFPTSTYLLTYVYLPTYTNLPSSTYLSLPIPKYQYIITADPGASISLVTVIIALTS